MTVPFPPAPGVAREPLPEMTRRSWWERFVDRFTPWEPTAGFRPSRLDRKDGIR